jgi:hypothetical protein
MESVEYVSTDDLIAELLRRHDAAVFICSKRVSDDSWVTSYNYEGGFHAALGLMADCRHQMLSRKIKHLSDEEKSGS